MKKKRTDFKDFFGMCKPKKGEPSLDAQAFKDEIRAEEKADQERMDRWLKRRKK